MTHIITVTFYPKTRQEWREWLQKNHAKKREIWLICYKKHTGKPAIDYQDSVDEALCFGWVDGIEKSIDDEKYAQRFTPRANKSNWSEGNVARYKLLIKQELMTDAGKKAFANKKKVYTPAKMTEAGQMWHKTYKMPKNPALKDRIKWHRVHQKYCACRSVPKNLQKLMV